MGGAEKSLLTVLNFKEDFIDFFYCDINKDSNNKNNTIYDYEEVSINKRINEIYFI